MRNVRVQVCKAKTIHIQNSPARTSVTLMATEGTTWQRKATAQLRYRGCMFQIQQLFTLMQKTCYVADTYLMTCKYCLRNHTSDILCEIQHISMRTELQLLERRMHFAATDQKAQPPLVLEAIVLNSTCFFAPVSNLSSLLGTAHDVSGVELAWGLGPGMQPQPRNLPHSGRSR